LQLLIFVGVPKTKLSPLEIGQILSELILNYNLKAAQILDNRYIWGKKHILSAIWHALKAYQNNRMISKTLSMEILLYTAGFRQIKKAVELLGIRGSTEEVVGIIIGEKQDQIIESCISAQKSFQLDLRLDLLNNLTSKHQYILKLLINEGFYATNFSNSEIENAILQRIAILALE